MNNNTAVTANGATQYHIETVLELFTCAGTETNDADLFYDMFARSLNENKDLAVRTMLWSYDCRGGAGRRSNFLRVIPKAINDGHLTETEAKAIIDMVPELGRWDAVFKMAENIKNKTIQSFALDKICKALLNGDRLCAKWMPRKGLMAERIRGYFNKVLNHPLSRKGYRKLLVTNTDVVESIMSRNDWSSINYETVPSVAGARYSRAFSRHDSDRYDKYLGDVAKGEAKINTSVLYPHDIARMYESVDKEAVDTYWSNIHDYEVDGNILCMADVSGSMEVLISGKVSAISVALSLAIYFSERATGLWKDQVMLFSGTPELCSLSGYTGFSEKYEFLRQASPDPFNTDIRLAYIKLLQYAKNNNTPTKDMPKALVILSDMQFDYIGPEAIDEDIKQSFREAGYDVPRLIYWNLFGYCNGVPVSTVLSADSVMFSGYDPKGIECVLGTRTLMDIFMDTVNVERYSWC